jgi:hypothetical protein
VLCGATILSYCGILSSLLVMQAYVVAFSVRCCLYPQGFGVEVVRDVRYVVVVFCMVEQKARECNCDGVWNWN